MFSFVEIPASRSYPYPPDMIILEDFRVGAIVYSKTIDRYYCSFAIKDKNEENSYFWNSLDLSWTSKEKARMYLSNNFNKITTELNLQKLKFKKS